MQTKSLKLLRSQSQNIIIEFRSFGSGTDHSAVAVVNNKAGRVLRHQTQRCVAPSHCEMDGRMHGWTDGALKKRSEDNAEENCCFL